MATHEFVAADFRAMFPAFASAVKFPDLALSMYFDTATCYIDNEDNCLIMGDCLERALYMLTAHIGQLMTNAGTDASGGSGAAGIVSASTVEKVSVTVTVPPTKNGWEFWLASTPYGMMLWQMLKAKTAGGFAVGMMPESSGFRKAYGVF